MNVKHTSALPFTFIHTWVVPSMSFVFLLLGFGVLLRLHPLPELSIDRRDSTWELSHYIFSSYAY